MFEVHSLENLGGDRILGIFEISEEISAKNLLTYICVENVSQEFPYLKS